MLSTANTTARNRTVKTFEMLQVKENITVSGAVSVAETGTPKKRVPKLMYVELVPGKGQVREPYNRVGRTFLWPKKNSLVTECSFAKAFFAEARKISGELSLIHGKVFVSKYATCYTKIIRFSNDNDMKYATDNADGYLIRSFFRSENTTTFVALDDLKFYLANYSHPLVLLVGEDETRTEEPHCVCILLQKVNDAWEATLKESLELEVSYLRPRAKEIIQALGIQQVTIIPLLVSEKRDSCNCVGHAFNCAAKVLDGIYPKGLEKLNGCQYKTYSITHDKFLSNHFNYYNYGKVAAVEKNLVKRSLK